MHQIYVYKCLKTMLVKYKLVKKIIHLLLQKPLKTMLVKYKYDAGSINSFGSRPFKNNAC